MPNWKKLIVSGSSAELTTLKLTGLSAGTPTTALMLDGSGNVEKRTLGSNAFNSTAFTTNTGTVTNVTVGSGLDISNSTTTPAISLDLTEITLGAGLDSTATGLSLDLSELTDMTAAVNTSQDELILLDNGAERRKRFSEIFGTAAYKPTTDFLPGNDDGYVILDSTDGTATSAATLKYDSGVLHVGSTATSNSEIRLLSNDTTQATLAAYGSAQGTGRLYLGQSSTYGGGIVYNGDDNPNIVNTTDTISFYRREGGTDTEVFRYAYNSNTVNFVGDVVAFASSDERLKTNIKPIENTLDKIDRIGGYNFDWVPKEGIHENEGSDIGVIAQEIEKEFPELVTTREDGYKAVKYDKLSAVLLQAVKDLRKELNGLKSKS